MSVAYPTEENGNERDISNCPRFKSQLLQK